jgi:hypothetical protein
VRSMMSLSTPCKSLADQAKTSLFLFKNCISYFSSSGLRWAPIVTPLSGISSRYTFLVSLSAAISIFFFISLGFHVRLFPFFSWL